MGNKLAFIDLDGIVCNSHKRFAQAYQKGRLDWSSALQPSLLALDELLPYADTFLAKLEEADWAIIFLSSRPENLRKATKEWLKSYKLLTGLSGERQLILKPQKSRFTTTPKWKAEVVCAGGGKAEQVLLVDDEAENLNAAKGLWRAKNLDRTSLKTCKSLDSIEEFISTQQILADSPQHD